MIIARQKKKENIIEYVLYMWHIEDLIRAYGFNLESIEKEIISKFDIDDETYDEMKDWYDNLIQLMMNEKVIEAGHIQALTNIVSDITEFHFKLLQSPLHADYQKEFENLLPYISDLLEKVKNKDRSVVEILLEAMYGVLLLRLQKEKISKETLEAIGKISQFLALLAAKYQKFETDEEFKI